MVRKINDGKTRNQRYYERHKAAEAARVATWRANNPNFNAEACRRYYEAHVEKERERARAYYQDKRKPADKSPAGHWKDRQRKAQRRARMVTECPLTAAEWQEVLEAHQHRCAYCGAAGPLEIDHVVALSRGGLHTKSNVVPACKPCNSRKGAR